MKFEAFKDKVYAPDWRVEATDDESDGSVHVTLFSGPIAKERAVEYAMWKNGRANQNRHGDGKVVLISNPKLSRTAR